MKAGFFFDTFLLRSDDDNYYGMTLNLDFFQSRYLELFDQLIVSTRVKKIEDDDGNHSGYKIVNGNNVEVIPINSYKNIPDAFLKHKEIVGEIENVLEQVDVAIIRMPSMIGNITCDICEKINKPYLIEMVACAWDGYINHKNKFGKIVAPYMFFATRKRVKKATKVLYVTNSFLQKRYPTQNENLACSDVALKEFDNNILDNRLKKIESMDIEKEIKLCTIANVGLKYKGQEYVFKAIAKLKKKGFNYKYYLAGNGNKERLERIVERLNIKENVVFLGSLNHDEVFKLLDEIDIYLQPSLQEGLPRATIEAMSRACVCIGSDVGGIPELLNKNMIFKHKKVNQLAKMLEKINITEMKEYARENFQKAQEFKKEVLDNKRKKIYTNLMNNK